MEQKPAPNLLDIFEELLQLPPEQREGRIGELGLCEADRRKIKSWVRDYGCQEGQPDFLDAPPPPLIGNAMKLLQESLSSASALGDGQHLEAVEAARRFITASDAAVRPHVPGYEISDLLGEGGMATVWRAVQLSTRRAVALKLLRGGAGSPRQQMRFEREVELAARLEHPSIAHVYDSGSFEGRFFYAMELVEGQPLDEYVRQRKLSTRQILESMQEVCAAVQHAHQRGVIHRDLKPSNILITKEGRLKVLDFGLAKGLGESKTELTLTQDGQVTGTPAFMSPEQASGHLDRLDIRTDVYSLGVVLYRLLTGWPPDRSRQVLQCIPCARASCPLPQVLGCISTKDVPSPRKICPQIDLELEALLLKALDRDPNRRYGSVTELAQDIERYLKDEPVQASPPTATYRLRKLARRHKIAIAVTCGVMLFLIIATAVSSWQAVRLARARSAEAAQRKRAETVAELLTSVLPMFDPYLDSKAGASLRKELMSRLDQTAASFERDYANEPLTLARLRDALGITELRLGETEKARALLQAALNEQKAHGAANDPETLKTMHHLALAEVRAGHHDQARKLLEQVRDQQVKALGMDHADTLSTLNDLALLLSKPDEAIKLLEQLRDEEVRKFGEDDPQTLETMHNLAAAYDWAGAREQAIKIFEQVRDQQVRILGVDNPNTLATLNHLARDYSSTGRHDEAIALLEQVRDRAVREMGSDDSRTLITQNSLAHAYEYADRDIEAINLFEQNLPREEQILGPEHPQTLDVLFSLGWMYLRRKQYDKAETYYRPLAERAYAHPAPRPPWVSKHLRVDNLITCYRALGQQDQAQLWEQKFREFEKDAAAGLLRDDGAWARGQN